MSSFDEPFAIWMSTQPTTPGHLGGAGAGLKNGPGVYKSVRLSAYGNIETGEISRHELRFSTYPSLGPGRGYDFGNPTVTWHCENEEIDRLMAFLHANVAKPGRYRVVDSEDPQALIIDALTCIDVDATQLSAALSEAGVLEKLVPLLMSNTASRLLAEQAVIQRRRDLLTRLAELAATSGTTETEVQAELGAEYWVFGGRYVGVARRNLVNLDQHDIPLLGADGSLHIVELKGPCIKKLVRRHRNHWIVGDDVHEAVAQAMNYLRGLDELGAAIATVHREDLGVEYDMRRSFATVVIGHPVHNESGANEKDVEQTIRSYNAHLSRVQVITYKSLFDTASRALAFEEEVLDEPIGDEDEKPQEPTSGDPWAHHSAPTDPWLNPADSWSNPVDPWASPD